MSDHTHDPIRDLEHFGTGGIAVNPLEPAQVRRLGDRRRARQRNASIAIAAVAVVAAIVPAAVLANRDAGGNGAPQILQSPTPTPTPAPTATPTPETITYAGQGIEVHTAADTAKLTDTTDEFKAFITDQAQKATDEGSACPDASHGVTVQKYSSAGYALGGVNSCGGYAALWVLKDGQWQEGMGTQDTWDCDTLTYLGVPKSFAGDCADEAGDFGPDQVSGLRLGMTSRQIEAAGGTVQGDATGTCATFTLPHQSPVQNRVDGYIAPKDGLVLIEARSSAKTPKRIGLGSSATKVKAAYPNGHDSYGYWIVPLSGNAEYEFQIGQDHSVVEMILARPAEPCTQ